MPSAAREFFPWAQKNLPARSYQRLRAMYENAPYGPESFKKEIAVKFEALRRKYGLNSQVGVNSAKDSACAIQFAAWAARSVEAFGVKILVQIIFGEDCVPVERDPSLRELLQSHRWS